MTGRKAVLVTGAAGFIGAHLTRRLASTGHEVRALDVKPNPFQNTGPQITYCQGDIRDTGRLAELARGVDTVYHLASVHLQVHTAEAGFEDVNVRAVEGLVCACAEAGIRRLVHTSSVGIYGHVEDPPAREDSPKSPETPYERTKLAGEQAALRRALATGLDAIVLRPAWVYGPGCPRTVKLLRALRKRRFFYVGDGSNLRHPLFIKDMLDAFLLAAGAPSSLAGRGYIVAGPRSMTLREMVETFARVLNVPAPKLSIPKPIGHGLGLATELAFGLLRSEPPFSRRSLALFENNNAFDTTAAERDLGFRAKVDLKQGLQLTVADTSWAAAA